MDNDPVVLLHARALLTSGPEGVANYVDADLRDTGRVLAQAAETFDFSAPLAVMLVSVLHVIPDRDDPAAIVARLMDAAAPGSFLCISHPASDIDPAAAEAASRYNALAGQPGPAPGPRRRRAFLRRLGAGRAGRGAAAAVAAPRRTRSQGPCGRVGRSGAEAVSGRPDPDTAICCSPCTGT